MILEIEPGTFSANKPTFWSPGGRLVCHEANNSVPSLLQLAARSVCRSNRCISPVVKGVCQPPMESDRQGAGSNSGATSQGRLDSTRLESATLVPHASRNADRLPEAEDGTDIQPTPILNHAQSSRMAHQIQRPASFRGRYNTPP